MPQGNEPLHTARDVVLVSLRTNEAVVGGVLVCELPCGGTRYVGSGLSKYDGMQFLLADGSEYPQPLRPPWSLSLSGIVLTSQLKYVLSKFIAVYDYS